MEQRQEVRLLKAIHNISYTEIAQEIGIRPSSLYNWLRGSYQFSANREAQLQSIIDRYKEADDGYNI